MTPIRDKHAQQYETPLPPQRESYIHNRADQPWRPGRRSGSSPGRRAAAPLDSRAPGGPPRRTGSSAPLALAAFEL